MTEVDVVVSVDTSGGKSWPNESELRELAATEALKHGIELDERAPYRHSRDSFIEDGVEIDPRSEGLDLFIFSGRING